MAAFLSSLRIFTDLVNAKKMDQASQNNVLSLIHAITRFPPAFRAVQILMADKRLKMPECAALAQSVYEVLKEIFPQKIVQDDASRVFEGSRFFFGFILDKARLLKTSDGVLPYLDSFKTLDIRDIETLEPILHPVQTDFGLSEEGYHKAHLEGGILCCSGGREPPVSVGTDPQTIRLALQSGGTKPEVTFCSLDTLNSLRRPEYIQEVEEAVALDRMPDVLALSALCEQNGLAVTAPSALPSSSAPALTLDRWGLMAVYVGRAPCAAPGKE